MLERITPIVLTYNEAPNIGRTLERLTWARDIIVVDSFSEDETLAIVAQTPQARIYKRKFDCLEHQWNYALRETNISTEWVLALDADYLLTPELLDEIEALQPPPGITGYRAKFVYCVYGQPLTGSAYPPVIVLYRHQKAYYRQDGHAHRVVVDGQIENLRATMLHDDWKSLSHWLSSQNSYQQLEKQKLLMGNEQSASLPDRIRKLHFVAPFFILFYCLFVKKGIFDGRAGIYYAYQRMLAETLLSLYLIDHDLTQSKSK